MRPLSSSERRDSRPDNEFIGDTLDELRKHGITEPCESSWASPVVVVDKKEEALAACVLTSGVNDVSATDNYPMPNAEALANRDKTAFITKQGLFRFTRMPFGLKNAPATYQRVMETVLTGLSYAKCYIDDILVYSPDMETHLEYLDIVFTRIHDVNMKIKAKKRSFVLEEVKYLGHFHPRRREARPRKCGSHQEHETAKDSDRSTAFLGTTGFYRRFIKGNAAIAPPLTDLTRHDMTSVTASWTPECTDAFNALRQALMTEPVLTRPNLDKPFILTTDWQPNSIAGILSQMSDNGIQQVIAYGSKKLSGPEANWSATDGEC